MWKYNVQLVLLWPIWQSTVSHRTFFLPWIVFHASHTNIDPFTIAENKLLIVKLGGLEQLIRQMASPNVEVQCNAVGCITNLATHGKSWMNNTRIYSHWYSLVYTLDDNKARIAKSDALRLLVDLARSKDQRVQRNATGALLNMTHTRKCNINVHHKIT